MSHYTGLVLLYFIFWLVVRLYRGSVDFSWWPINSHDEDTLKEEMEDYVESTYDIYLLRIIHSQDCVVSIYPAKVDGIIYIVSSIPVSKDSIKENIQKILHALEAYGFPKLRNPKSSITFCI